MSALHVPPVTGRSAARSAFARVWNLKSIAVVFYFCLLFIAGRYVMYYYATPFEEWINGFARLLRGSLISGLSLLMAIALTEAFAAGRALRPRSALALGILASIAVAAISVPVRLWAVGAPVQQRLAEEFSYYLSLFALWAALGSLAYWLFNSTREDELARAALEETECRRQSLQGQMVEAHLTALQAQIEPHFLFNTLANVKRLYETAPAQGQEMLASLINYLRAALPSMRQSGSTLSRELELARSFLTILKMRMRERLTFSIDHDPALDNARVPPMVLPTLVENAIKHGLSPLPQGGRIDIRAHRAGDELIVEVDDNGAGFSSSSGSGVGLANTRSRLVALYGARASLKLASASPSGVRASIRLPLELESEAAQ
ncbi:MAG TPA: histidine kinase [Burkholderiaceae bacterium]|nr:histidine kinase [Burkholderiaceae bacterium]